jgi:hypothetical protein
VLYCNKWVLAARARPCAARTRLFELIATKNRALRATPPLHPSQLRCFSFDTQKYIKSIELGPPTSKAFFYPLDHMQTAEAVKYEVPCPRPAHRSFVDPSGNILGQNYVHRKKRFASFPSPAGMSLPNSPWAGIMTS